MGAFSGGRLSGVFGFLGFLPILPLPFLGGVSKSTTKDRPALPTLGVVPERERYRTEVGGRGLKI